MYYSRRGLDLTGDTRFLSESTKTALEYSYLPGDDVTHTDRNRFKLTNVTKLPYDFRFIVDAETVSDSHYFEDFAHGTGRHERRVPRSARGLPLPQRALERERRGAAVPDDRSRPRGSGSPLRARAAHRRGCGLRLGPGGAPALRPRVGSREFRSRHRASPAGVSMRTPACRSTSEARVRYIRPGVSVRYTSYSLDYHDSTSTLADEPLAHAAHGKPRCRPGVRKGTPARADSGVSPLEPRMLYLHVPYKNQDNLPLFDTGIPT